LRMSPNLNIPVTYCHGTMIVEKKIRRRITEALGAMAGFKKIRTSKEISVKTQFKKNCYR